MILNETWWIVLTVGNLFLQSSPWKKDRTKSFQGCQLWQRQNYEYSQHKRLKKCSLPLSSRVYIIDSLPVAELFLSALPPCFYDIFSFLHNCPEEKQSAILFSVNCQSPSDAEPSLQSSLLGWHWFPVIPELPTYPAQRAMPVSLFDEYLSWNGRNPLVFSSTWKEGSVLTHVGLTS